jgi:hypothetical protein
MPTLSEIRQQYPDYNDLSDQALADALYKKHYSDMSRDEFDKKIGLEQSSPLLPLGGYADEAQQAREAAAARSRQGVTPEGGREQGFLSTPGGILASGAGVATAPLWGPLAGGATALGRAVGPYAGAAGAGLVGAGAQSLGLPEWLVQAAKDFALGKMLKATEGRGLEKAAERGAQRAVQEAAKPAPSPRPEWIPPRERPQGPASGPAPGMLGTPPPGRGPYGNPPPPGSTGTPESIAEALRKLLGGGP